MQAFFYPLDLMVKDIKPFLALLAQGERKFEWDYEFAKALRIDPTRYSKLKKGEAGVLGVERCLRLAAILHRPAGEVLRTAGHTRIADLLDHAYSPQATAATTIDDEEMASLWRGLESADRDLIRDFARRFRTPAADAPATTPKSPKRPLPAKAAQLKR